MTSGHAYLRTLRYLRIYGATKTLFKVCGRLRPRRVKLLALRSRREVGVIGCGQFAFATLGHALWKSCGHAFARCYDPDPRAMTSFASFFGCATASTADEVFRDPAVRVVYVTSNHASHSAYAVEALGRGKATYVEKPVAVDYGQLARLSQGVQTATVPVYAGYNRPFSPAVRRLRRHLIDPERRAEPFTLGCFVVGHELPSDHWYRDAAEGTRICGNLGHWIDLAVHLASVHELPDLWEVSLRWSDPTARDDDLSVAMASERGDLVNLVMTSRSEPFEGINETINFQCGELLAKIDDFRSMTVWKGKRRWSKRFFPKDVGHSATLLQPFGGDTRPWAEIEASTLMMLAIRNAVVEGRESFSFSFSESRARLAAFEGSAGPQR